MKRFILCFGLVLLHVTACGSKSSSSPAPAVTDTSGIADLADTSQAGIVAFLKKATYQTWLSEKSVHASAGPHGKVKIFYNATVASSLKNKESTHPRGSMLVKELYASDGTTLTGHSVSIKTGTTSEASSWIWFEGSKPDYLKPYYGAGITACTGCHAGGSDFVQSSYPE